VIDQSINLSALLILSFVFAVKHIVADFFLQTNEIALGKDRSVGWLRPWLLHVSGHALLTLVITLIVSPTLAWLAAVDFCVHGGIDRLKAVARAHWKLTPAQAPFWWLIGIDQALHHLTHLGLVILLIR
jgi:hypothetical protein